MTKTFLPIWNNRELVGHAGSTASAKRILKRVLNMPEMFNIGVWQRSQETQELLQLPAGFAYSVSFKY